MDYLSWIYNDNEVEYFLRQNLNLNMGSLISACLNLDAANLIASATSGITSIVVGSIGQSIFGPIYSAFNAIQSLMPGQVKEAITVHDEKATLEAARLAQEGNALAAKTQTVQEILHVNGLSNTWIIRKFIKGVSMLAKILWALMCKIFKI